MRPRLVLTSNTTANNEGFMALVTEGDTVEHSVTRSSDWDYQPSKVRVVEHLCVRDLMENGKTGAAAEDGGGGRYDNYQLLSLEFDFADRARVCALGGLVAYLQKNVGLTALQDVPIQHQCWVRLLSLFDCSSSELFVLRRFSRWSSTATSTLGACHRWSH